MTEYDNTNKWTLFRNDRKESDKHPDFTGTLNIDGVEYFLNAWTKESKNGKRFFSGTVKRKEPAAKKEAPRGSQPMSSAIDDEIPFAPEGR